MNGYDVTTTASGASWTAAALLDACEPRNFSAGMGTVTNPYN